MRLVTWWSEKRCATEWHGRVHPDGYGRWQENSTSGTTETDFFLEYDTGSETLGRVAAKLADYATLYQATHIPTPVLFWLPTAAREANLRKLLTETPVPVATASAHSPAHAAAHPAAAVWLPAGRQHPRLPLAALSSAWPK